MSFDTASDVSNGNKYISMTPVHVRQQISLPSLGWKIYACHGDAGQRSRPTTTLIKRRISALGKGAIAYVCGRCLVGSDTGEVFY